MRILDDGRVRYSAWTVPGLQPLVVFANYQTLTLDDKETHDTLNYSAMISWGDRPIFSVWVLRRRAKTAQFTYNLTPEQLRHAVSVVRHMGNGLEKWITPGLAHMHWGLTSMRSTPRVKALLAIIPQLLRAVRSIPIAKPWRLKQREWERWKREQKRKR